MHVKAKEMAFLGLLLAFTVILVVLSGVIEMSTLFFLAGAAFCVGIAIREKGIVLGGAFYIAAVLTSLIIAPNKIYCFTFAALGFYIVAFEIIHERVARIPWKRKSKALLWLVKYVVFNLLYLPILIIFPELFYTGDISTNVMALLLMAGQVGLVILDYTYRYFQGTLWERFRKQIIK